MAPTLFNLFFAAVFYAAFHDLQEEKGIQIVSRLDGRFFAPQMFNARTKTTISSFRDLCYADDCALCAHSQEQLQDFMNRFHSAATRLGLTVSFKKTEVLTNIRDDSHSKILLDGKALKITDKFKYLGGLLSKKATMEEEINARIAKAAITFGRLYPRVWRPKGIHMSTKIDIYKACVLSVLLYGAATWSLLKPQIKKLESFHHRCLRRILQIPWQNYTPTTQVLQQAGLPSIESMVISMRLKWLGHVRRLPNERLPKILMCGAILEGKRKLGKPMLRWKDVIKRDLNILGHDTKSWWPAAAPEMKTSWRSSIFKKVSQWEVERKEQQESKRRERKKKQAEREAKETKEGKIGQFSCPVCHTRFVQKSSMYRHLYQRHPQHKPSTTCDVCNRVFKSLSGLKRHKCRPPN